MKDVYVDGHWNFNILYTNIPVAICEQFKMIPIYLNSLVDDRITWKGDLDGIYTAKASYSWLNRYAFLATNDDSISWNWLWKILESEKINFFVLSAMHDSIPTK